MSEEETSLVMEYQRSFPELLQDSEGFCIDGRKLYKNLGYNESQENFTRWIKKHIERLGLIEGINYKSLMTDCTTMRPKGLSNYTLTIEDTKQICMVVGCMSKVNKETKMLSSICRKYFILIEKTLRKHKEWLCTRTEEKSNYNEMEKSIQDWCIRKGYDEKDRAFYTREINSINTFLTGYNAQGLRNVHGCDNNITRDFLDTETNSVLNSLQQYNIDLLDSDMGFEERMKLIKKKCENKYSHIIKLHK